MLVNFRALFGVLVDIMLLRRGPEHLPASPVLLGILVALNIVLYIIAGSVLLPAPRQGSPSPWLVQFSGIALVLLWFRIAFHLARKPERYVQTMIAMFAVNVLALPALPLFVALLPYAEQKPGSEPAPASLVLLSAILMFWLLAVLVRIVKSAFEWSWIGSIVFLVGSNFGILILLGLLFGDPPKAA